MNIVIAILILAVGAAIGFVVATVFHGSAIKKAQADLAIAVSDVKAKVTSISAAVSPKPSAAPPPGAKV